MARAYDPVARAAREARFRAEHGVSSGTYYRMRREAQRLDVTGAKFDKLARQQGYGAARDLTVAKRGATKAYQRGDEAGANRLVGELYDEMADIEDIDKEWFWYHG